MRRRAIFAIVAVLHDHHLTHTDLKPENILFVKSDYDILPGQYPQRTALGRKVSPRPLNTSLLAALFRGSECDVITEIHQQLHQRTSFFPLWLICIGRQSLDSDCYIVLLPSSDDKTHKTLIFCNAFKLWVSISCNDLVYAHTHTRAHGAAKQSCSAYVKGTSNIFIGTWVSAQPTCQLMLA